MNKITTICMTVFMLFTLAACGTAGEETASPAETTTEAATTVTTTTTEATTTTTTTTAAAKSLDDLIDVKEYDESKNNTYTLLSLDFSIPQYWTLDTTNKKEDRLRFYNQPKECERAILSINYGEFNGTASDFEKSRDDIQNKIMEKQTELSDVTNGKSIDGELNDGLPYRFFYFDGKTEKDKYYRKYVTMICDESVKKLYYIAVYQPFDTKYDYFSDYASVIDKGTKLNKSAEVTIDSVQYGQDSLGRTIAIVNMTYTNTAKTNEMFFTNYDCRAYQNKVELDNALFVDGVDSSALGKSVQPGGSLTISEAFILEDSSQITVEITNLLGTKTILSKKYNLN